MNVFNIKVVLVGDQAVGKSSLVHRFVDGSFRDSYIPTLGFEISVKTMTLNDANVVFSIWDIGAQQCFDPVRLHYYKGSQGFLMLFNLAMRGTFKNLNNWIVGIQQTCPGAPIFLVGNKADLPNRCITDPEIAEKVQQLGAKGYFLTSAKSGTGVLEAFRSLGGAVISAIRQ